MLSFLFGAGNSNPVPPDPLFSVQEMMDGLHYVMEGQHRTLKYGIGPMPLAVYKGFKEEIKVHYKIVKYELELLPGASKWVIGWLYLTHDVPLALEVVTNKQN